MKEIKRVAYSYNSSLEAGGQAGYSLDCYVSRDGRTLVDVQETYKSLGEFLRAVEEVIPIFADGSQLGFGKEDTEDDS